jgi:putative transposase
MQWVDELAPEMRKVRKGSVRFSYEQKTEAVLAFCSRNSAAQGVADDHGLSRTSLYKWKNELLVKEASANVSDGKDASHPHDKDALNREVKSLKEQIQKLQMERDILLGTIDIAKKDPGADPQNLTNQEKTKLIDALRQTYRLNDLLESLRLTKSSYFYHRIANSVDKYEELRAVIRRHFTENYECYGYRRNVFYHSVAEIRKNVHTFMEQIKKDPLNIIDRLCIRMESGELLEHH